MRGIVPKAVAVPSGDSKVIGLPTASPSRRASRSPTATPSSLKSASEPWMMWSASNGNERKSSGRIPRTSAPAAPVSEIAVEAQDAGEQIGAKPVHHRHDDDQGGDTERDPEQRKDRDDRDEPFLPPRPQITERDHPLEGAEHQGGAPHPPATRAPPSPR